MSESNLTWVVDAGVDYLTATTRLRRSGRRALSKAEFIALGERKKGNAIAPWSMSGFSGFRCGSIQYGYRGEECIVRLSGALAAAHWRSVADAADNISRVDLQVTLREESSARTRILSHYKAARRQRARSKGGPCVSLFSGDEGGSTLYLGKRTSERYGRVYDKFAESKDERYLGCVRYEVEFKNDPAFILVQRMKGILNESSLVQATVRQYFLDRGVVCRWRSNDSGLLIVPTAESPDADRQLAWLRSQVRPTVQSLIECGRVQDVVNALGLGPTLQPKVVAPAKPESVLSTSEVVH